MMFEMKSFLNRYIIYVVAEVCRHVRMHKLARKQTFNGCERGNFRLGATFNSARRRHAPCHAAASDVRTFPACKRQSSLMHGHVSQCKRDLRLGRLLVRRNNLHVIN